MCEIASQLLNKIDSGQESVSEKWGDRFLVGELGSCVYSETAVSTGPVGDRGASGLCTRNLCANSKTAVSTGPVGDRGASGLS